MSNFQNNNQSFTDFLNEGSGESTNQATGTTWSANNDSTGNDLLNQTLSAQIQGSSLGSSTNTSDFSTPSIDSLGGFGTENNGTNNQAVYGGLDFQQTLVGAPFEPNASFGDFDLSVYMATPLDTGTVQGTSSAASTSVENPQAEDVPMALTTGDNENGICQSVGAGVSAGSSSANIPVVDTSTSAYPLAGLPGIHEMFPSTGLMDFGNLGVPNMGMGAFAPNPYTLHASTSGHQNTDMMAQGLGIQDPFMGTLGAQPNAEGDASAWATELPPLASLAAEAPQLETTAQASTSKGKELESTGTAALRPLAPAPAAQALPTAEAPPNFDDWQARLAWAKSYSRRVPYGEFGRIDARVLASIPQRIILTANNPEVLQQANREFAELRRRRCKSNNNKAAKKGREKKNLTIRSQVEDTQRAQKERDLWRSVAYSTAGPGGVASHQAFVDAEIKKFDDELKAKKEGNADKQPNAK